MDRRVGATPSAALAPADVNRSRRCWPSASWMHAGASVLRTCPRAKPGAPCWLVGPSVWPPAAVDAQRTRGPLSTTALPHSAADSTEQGPSPTQPPLLWPAPTPAAPCTACKQRQPQQPESSDVRRTRWGCFGGGGAVGSPYQLGLVCAAGSVSRKCC